MKIVATMSLPAVDRQNPQPLERRTLVAIWKSYLTFSIQIWFDLYGHFNKFISKPHAGRLIRHNWALGRYQNPGGAGGGGGGVYQQEQLYFSVIYLYSTLSEKA